MRSLPGDTLYSLAGVQQTYDGRTVLSIDELEIRRGEILALVGPSGAGKSTLLRLLAFLEKPAAGSLIYQDQVCGEKWPDLNTRRKVTMVFQRPHLLHRSVSDNIAYGLKLRGRGNGGEHVATMLQRLGLEELAAVQANTLSGGEAQRVALARALILQPDVLLLDEPTSNLDPYNINLIEEMVRQTNRDSKMSVIMVTHNIFQAKRLANRVALLLSGRLVEVSEADTFFNTPRRAETAAFVRGEIVY